MPNLALPWPINVAALTLLCASESCVLKAYRKFPKEPRTCGWGETEGVGPTTVWTQDYADQRLLDSLNVLTHQVRELCAAPTTDNELGAFVVLAYNIGINGFAKSTVLRQHNLGNKMSAARAFKLWDKVKDKDGKLVESAGLLARRMRESALYLKPSEGAAPDPMPQVVAPETSLVKSPIAVNAGSLTAGGAVVTIASLGDQAQQIAPALGSIKTAADAAKEVIESMAAVVHIPPVGLAGIAAAIVGLLILRTRMRQRSEGWA